MEIKNQYSLDEVYSGHRSLVPPGTEAFVNAEDTRAPLAGEWFIDSDGTVTLQRGSDSTTPMPIVVPTTETGTTIEDDGKDPFEEDGNPNAEWWDICEEVLPHAPRVLLYGPPGTGKTTLGIMTGRGNEQEVSSITLNEDTAAQEVVGHFVFKGNNTEWHDGPAIMSWKGDGEQGGMLVINEIAEASGPVLTALYAILDDPTIAQLTLASGETVTPNTGFKVVATTNEDPEVLPEALLDRFDVVICADRPTPVALETLPEPMRGMCLNSYKAYNKGSDRQQLITFREAKAFSKLVEAGVRLNPAAISVFGKKRGPEFTRDYKLARARME